MQAWPGRVLCALPLLALHVGCKREASPPAEGRDAALVAGPVLLDVGPRIVSNQTPYPISLYGQGFERGMVLALSGERRVELPTDFVDEAELSAVVPPEAMRTQDAGRELFDLKLELVDPRGRPIGGSAQLSVVNDLDFFTPTALEVDAAGGRIFVSSRSTDEVWSLDRRTGALSRIGVADGPVALARWGRGKETWLVVSHENSPELLAFDVENPESRFSVRVPARSRGVVVHGSRAYLANQLEDAVLEIDLDRREVRRRLSVGVNPGAVAVGDAWLVVGNHGSDDASVVRLEDGRERRLVPGPGLSIIGGHTEPYSKYIMGGKVPRALALDGSRGLIFAAGLGPNIGPNPDRMEVTMNGGISVIDPASARISRHVSLLRGVPEALALDQRRGLLYAADLATGRIVVLDAAKLARDDTTARSAILGALELSPPEGMPLVRPAEDFSVEGRSGTSIHTGPSDLRLVDGGRTLLVLCRFSREVLELDLGAAARGQLTLRKRHRLGSERDQPTRRLGEILYFTDLGNSRMTCDTCHPSGHAGGMLFTKGRPIRIYRSPSIRAARESPPFFTPTKLESLYDMSRQVLARNRYENPVPTRLEKRALTLYSTLFPTPPNPYRGPRGERPETLALPDGGSGRPAEGRRIFHGKGACASAQCHPPPHYTADQNPATRGLLHHVGTPLALGLRPELQDMEPDYGWPPAPLVGVWDYFPLLMSGAGGFEVVDGATIEARHPFALRRVLQGSLARTHGEAAGLTEEELNDLIAFLLTL